MKRIALLVFLTLLLTAYLYGESPVHGAWINERLHRWLMSNLDNEIAGLEEFRRTHDGPVGVWETVIDGRRYIAGNQQPRISHDKIITEGAAFDIISFEVEDNRVIYQLSLWLDENSCGTITIVMVAENVIYFESYSGDEEFVRWVRNTNLLFTEKQLWYRIRVSETCIAEITNIEPEISIEENTITTISEPEPDIAEPAYDEPYEETAEETQSGNPALFIILAGVFVIIAGGTFLVLRRKTRA